MLLMFGVIVDVGGMVSGEGYIVWNVDGVMSNGVFCIVVIDLVVVFGLVMGIVIEIYFIDLLNL